MSLEALDAVQCSDVHHWIASGDFILQDAVPQCSTTWRCTSHVSGASICRAMGCLAKSLRPAVIESPGCLQPYNIIMSVLHVAESREFGICTVPHSDIERDV